MQKRQFVWLLSPVMACGLAACSDTSSSTHHSEKEVTVEHTERTVSETMPPAPMANSLTDSDIKTIRNMLGDVVDQSLSKGDLDNVVGYLSTNDQNRIGKYANNSYPDLDGRIDQIRTAWKNKFNQDFKIRDDDAAFSAYRVVGDKYHAFVTVPSMNSDWPAFNLALVNEGKLMNAWRIDIPDSIDGQAFKDRMLTHLTKVGERASSWPDDMHDSYRAISYHVFSAMANPKPAP